jgi:hypothetical protein
MNSKELEELWLTINYDGQFIYKRLSLTGKPSLNIGVNSILQRCLILELPQKIDFKLPNSVKQNLSLEYLDNVNCLSIVLLDTVFFDLFNDLAISIFNRTADLDSPKEYAQEFINSFYKWSSFFQNKNSSILTSDEVKGLFGELCFLKNKLLKPSANVDEILESWKGPYDTGHDFISDFLDHEIKTVDVTKNNIKISSEYQLDSDSSKELELVVVTVKTDNENGLTLKSIIDEVREIVYRNFGDQSIFINALFQKGLNFSGLEIYNGYKYLPIKETSYRCTGDDFPKLIRSQISNTIHQIKYSIKLNLIKEFIINEIVY